MMLTFSDPLSSGPLPHFSMRTVFSFHFVLLLVTPLKTLIIVGILICQICLHPTNPISLFLLGHISLLLSLIFLFILELSQERPPTAFGPFLHFLLTWLATSEDGEVFYGNQLVVLDVSYLLRLYLFFSTRSLKRSKSALWKFEFVVLLCFGPSSQDCLTVIALSGEVMLHSG